MIFVQHRWGEGSPFDPRRAASSLGIFAGRSADWFESGEDFFAQLPRPRSRPNRSWRPAPAPGGTYALLSGWIDNSDELREQLGTDVRDAGAVYARAVEKWGVDADARISGAYAAIAVLADGTVRLSRSPWYSKPLFYFRDRSALLACSLVRPIFAAGVTKRLRPAAVDALLTMLPPDEIESAFEGILLVPQGAVVLLTKEGQRTHRWYDPLAIRDVSLPSDDAYVEAANALLSDAVKAALRVDGKVGTTLSGGLDSSLVTAELLRQLPDTARLPSFTFVPLSKWVGSAGPGRFATDRPYVERFAQMHDRLDAHFVDNQGIGPGDRAEQLFLACDAGYPARSIAYHYHGVFAAAKDQGCDWLMTADFGNQSISLDAFWAWSEFALCGKWLELWRLARAQTDGFAGTIKRIGGRSILPLLPAPLSRYIETHIGRSRASEVHTNRLLRRDGRLGGLQSIERGRRAITHVEDTSSRARYISDLYANCGAGSEVFLGYEQIFGLQLRDVTAYRPLIEFCLGLPTEQFVRAGETRYLARRMAVGRMPEDQRTNRDIGAHNVDWHLRMSQNLKSLRREVEELAAHPDLGAVIDVDYARKLLEDWPQEPPIEEAESAPYRFYLPAMLHVRRYVDAMTGRNA